MLWIFCALPNNEFSHFVAAKYEACILLIALLFRPIVHTCYRIISIIVQRICIRGMLLSHVTQCLLLVRYCTYFGAFTECSSKTKWQVCSYVSRKCCSYALNYCMYYTSLLLMGVSLIWRFHCHLAIAMAYFKRLCLQHFRSWQRFISSRYTNMKDIIPLHHLQSHRSSFIAPLISHGRPLRNALHWTCVPFTAYDFPSTNLFRGCAAIDNAYM